MTSKQKNLSAMSRASLGVLRKYQAVWSRSELFQMAMDDLALLSTEIEEEIKRQTVAAGLQAKAAALDAVADLTLKTAGVLCAYANRHGQYDLQNKANLCKTALRVGRPAEIGARADKIADLAEKNLGEIPASDLKLTQIQALRSAASAYTQAAAAPRVRLSEVSSATTALKALLAQVVSLYDYQLDKLMESYLTSHPDFYHEYQTARVIVDIPGGRGSKATPPTGTGDEPAK